MNNKQLYIFFALSLASQAQTPVPCSTSNLGTQYTLNEPLFGSADQLFYVLSADGFSVKPGCAQGSAKYIDLNSGQTIISFSDESGGTGFSKLSVTESCTGQVLFQITSHNFGYQVQKADGSCLAQVLSPDNLANQMTLRDCQKNPIAQATKTFTSTAATWQVNITGPSVPVQLMPYLLAMKDNAGFSCPLPTTHHGLSTGAAIAIAAASCAAVFGIGMHIYRTCFLKKDLKEAFSSLE